MTRSISAWARALRIEYQGDNLLTWLSATLAAVASGAAFDRAWFLLGLATLILAQAALELLDGYHDFVQGAHGRKLPGQQVWTGGSGVLAEGALSPRAVQRAAWTCGLLACALFAVLTAGRTGVPGLIIGAAGAFCGAGWAMPPFKLSYRGLGEIAQAIVAGPLMAAMAWVVAAGRFDARSLAIGAPFGLLELCMALAHNMVDAEPDARAGKRTLVVRIGARAAALAYAFAATGVFVSLAVLVLLGTLPLSSAVVFLWAPLAFRTARLVRGASREKAELDRLASGFPPYNLLVRFGLSLVVVLFLEAARARSSHALFLAASFALCFAPVALVLRRRGAL